MPPLEQALCGLQVAGTCCGPGPDSDPSGPGTPNELCDEASSVWGAGGRGVRGASVRGAGGSGGGLQQWHRNPILVVENPRHAGKPSLLYGTQGGSSTLTQIDYEWRLGAGGRVMGALHCVKQRQICTEVPVGSVLIPHYLRGSCCVPAQDQRCHCRKWPLS